MATVRNYQRSFNGGEVSESMYSRIDDGKYQTGLALCKNFLIEPQGPIVNRPGFEYVNKVKDPSKPPRLIPFTFSADQTMVLEFGEKYIRFHTEGKTVLGDNGQPYEVVTPYLASEVFEIEYVQSADVLTLCHPAHAPAELRRYGATDWRLVTIAFVSKLSAPTGVTATQTINASVQNQTDYVRQYCVTALLADGTQESAVSSSASVNCNPYGDGAYNTISWNAVSGAGLYRIYRNQGGLWCFIGQTSSTSIRDENIDPDASITPPQWDDPFFQSGGITSVTVNNAGSGYGQKKRVTGLLPGSFTVYNAPGGSNSQTTITNSLPPYGDLGGAINTGYNAARPEDLTNVAVTSATGSGARISFLLTNSTYNGQVLPNDYLVTGYRVDAEGSGYLATDHFTGSVVRGNNLRYGVAWDFPLKTESVLPRVYVTDSTGTGAELEAQVNDQGQITAIRVVKPGSGYTNPVVHIDASESGGNGATATANVGQSGDYPGAVSYFEGRRWFGGTYSRPNWLWATKSGTDSDMSYCLPSQDSDRIAAAVVARSADRILHIVPLARLVFLTASAEWLATTKNSDVITQSSLSVATQAYFGSSPVQPIIVGSTLLYAASRGGHLRECGYSYEAGGYITNDICLRAPHLFDNLSILDMSYGKAPFPQVWAVSSNGKLIALTYVPEQQVGAFSTIETQGDFLSCCVVAEGDEDILYAVVRRTINGVETAFVERMHERQFKSLEQCVYLDCSGTYEGEPKTEITGLTWLEGMEVSILADGSVEPPQKVVNGKITLDEPASVVHVGLPYTCEAETLPVAVALNDGSYGSGHEKNVISMTLRVINSSGIKAGPTFLDMKEYPARGNERAGIPPEPISDEIEIRVSGQWRTTGQCCIRQENPLPMKIISMTTKVEIV